MSATNALLRWDATLPPAFEPVLAVLPTLQCHAIPVRVHLGEQVRDGMLRALAGTRYAIELAQALAERHARIGLSFAQRLGGGDVVLWLAVASSEPGGRCLEIEAEQAPPSFLAHDAAGPALPATARSPVFFNRDHELTVTRLHPLYGEFAVVNSDTVLPPGIDVELAIPCLWAGPVRVRAQVIALYRRHGNLVYGFRTLDSASQAAIARLLLCRAEGYSFDSLPPALRRRHVIGPLIRVAVLASRSGLEQALDCRLTANQQYGRLHSVETAASLWDEYDPYAIHVAATIGGKTVGAGRIVINEGHRDRCEIEGGSPLPEWLWRQGFVEVSRIAVRPGYAGRWVMLALLREVGRVTLSMGHRYIVLDAIEVLMPVYQRLGARCLPMTKRHPYSGEKVYIMYFDVGASLAAFGSRLAHWLAVFGPAVAHTILRQNMAEYGRRYRVGAWRLWLKKGLAHAGKRIFG